MRWPRKGVLIRLAIYVPVIAFFSYQAFCTADDVPEEPVGEDAPKFQVIELSPEEAEKMMGRELPLPAKDDAIAAEATKPAPPAVEAEAPAP